MVQFQNCTTTDAKVEQGNKGSECESAFLAGS